ncbi:MAG TPA: hypothetical protein VG756_16900 [Pseudonocardiaceae bacterium]|nr:hypothetical protein [Pseudonocardiaceae bacterium]
MRRVVVLGRGGAVKSTLATRLGAAVAMPVVELDKRFWAPDLIPLPAQQWATLQRPLVSGERWILDGDLGPYDGPGPCDGLGTYDVLAVRLRAADTVLVLDFPLWRCAWRVLRQPRPGPARTSLSGAGLSPVDAEASLLSCPPCHVRLVMSAIAEHAGHAELRVLRNPHAVARLLSEADGMASPE